MSHVPFFVVMPSFGCGTLLSLIVVVTSVHWSLFVSQPLPSALHLPPSHPRPILGLKLSLGAEFWEHFSMWNAEVQSRGVTPVHCSNSKKRNRLWWGQFLSVPKKQALSHTDFLPHWTAQNNPRPTSKAKKKKREWKRAVGEVSMYLKRYSQSLRLRIWSWKHRFSLQSAVFTWLHLCKGKGPLSADPDPCKTRFPLCTVCYPVDSQLLLSLLPEWLPSL